MGKLIGLVKKPFKYQVRPVGGPGSPGELFVEGERFNIQRFYQNQTPRLPLLAQGRIYTPDVPFDPYSIRNIAMATMTGVMPSRGGRAFTMIGKPGYSITIPFPCRPQSAAQAGQAIAGQSPECHGDDGPANQQSRESSCGPPAMR